MGLWVCVLLSYTTLHTHTPQKRVVGVNTVTPTTDTPTVNRVPFLNATGLLNALAERSDGYIPINSLAEQGDRFLLPWKKKKNYRPPLPKYL